jgi:2-oxo-4-hydroxy-4-carboxy-5-ureidoimidazoline decarboxylase
MAATTMTSEEVKPTVRELLSATNPQDMISVLGGIYEHSVWVAEQFVATLKDKKAEDDDEISSVSDLAAALKRIVNDASREQKLALLRAHPDLCEKVEKLVELTKDSQQEQSNSGLQSLTADEKATFTKLNTLYREKCHFPFILAVRNATKYTVLAALQGRVNNTVEQEFVVALEQVHKIAWMRLLSKINTDNAKGFLTCHVLDTANGCPGMCNIMYSYSFCLGCCQD